MTFTNWLKSLFVRKPSKGEVLASMIRRRTAIRDEMNGLTQQIARLRKSKKKFSHLEARFIELRSELSKLDAS
jgi:hypothetical protein